MSAEEMLSADGRARRGIRERFDRTLLVEASAGTGKTTEMVLRIVNLLASGATAVDRFVAVTFTEKAASELKLRLREQLDRARLETAGSRRINLDLAVTHLEEAHINTIHGFCAELLRERPVEARVDPAFEVLVGPAARRLFDRVFDDWFSRMLENPPPGIRRALVRRYADEQVQDRGPIDRLRRAAWELSEWRDFSSPWRRDPRFDRAAWINELLGVLRAFVTVSGNPARSTDVLATDTHFVAQAHRDIDERLSREPGDLDELEGLLASLTHHRDRARMRNGSGAAFGAHASRADVVAARDGLFAQLDTFTAAADADLAALLHDELGDVVAAYESAKETGGQLDFLDLLIRARDLLRNHEDVRRDFQSRFDHILVDEFQDTDPIQAELLLLLAASDPGIDDWRKVVIVPGKLFIVADPKQSIYRFRRADVGIYQEVKSLLVAQGVEPLHLSRSFRADPAIQAFVNRVFAPLMREDPVALQAEFVPLEPWRDAFTEQPGIIALPVPAPYGVSRISGAAIDKSLPAAVGAFVAWLLQESGWTVTERTPRGGSPERLPVAARHVCLVFRRFESWGRDVTRPYVEALEAHDVPHLLVGGRSFDGREEVESIKSALRAIEWPDDELAVFATLRGALFAFDDGTLLRWRQSCGRLSPFAVPATLPAELMEVGQALGTLRGLHQARNRVPVAETIGTLLDATRAHAGLALRPSGEQALANVLHIAELARRYAAAGGASFREFVEDLVEGRFADESDAPILEEGGDGVRIMTLHKAKGLEFPVVVLCDPTANLTARRASRYVNPAADVCALRLAGCAPLELIEHEQEELVRERAEGIRAAYVAATRARDLLVVPCVGDEPYDTARSKWVSVLCDGLYPPVDSRRDPEPSDGCPAFPTKDSVLERPNGESAHPRTVAPGRHWIADAGTRSAPAYPVTWWDPHLLDLAREPSLGLRETELISKDVDSTVVASDLATYHQWQEIRSARVAAGTRPSLRIESVTARTRALATTGTSIDEAAAAEEVTLVALPGKQRSVSGVRYGSLLHAVLATVPLDANRERIEATVLSHARLAGATPDEVRVATDTVIRLVEHDLLIRARQANRTGRCHREAPITVVEADGVVVEGLVDLAFEEDGVWHVVDFKTDRDPASTLDRYRLQIAVYMRAVALATGRPVQGWLVRV